MPLQKPPNSALQLTASREIGGFLNARCGALAAAECQTVRRDLQSLEGVWCKRFFILLEVVLTL
jgi:hypothetical protein